MWRLTGRTMHYSFPNRRVTGDRQGDGLEGIYSVRKNFVTIVLNLGNNPDAWS